MADRQPMPIKNIVVTELSRNLSGKTLINIFSIILLYNHSNTLILTVWACFFLSMSQTVICT